MLRRTSLHLVYHLYTAFLFTKSDIKTTVVPVTMFAIAASPHLQISQFGHIVFWIWLHVLQFDVSNQTLHPDEDAVNKRDRPLPSRRISLPTATLIRWLLILPCWGLSYVYSVETLCASITLVALTVLYNELAAHGRHWIIRNMVNAAGFASFELGATLVGTHGHREFDGTSIRALLLSAGIFATTIHAQDFKDVQGDQMIGRLTIPIVFPEIARYTIVIGLLVWSTILVNIWDVDEIVSGAFITMATFVGVRFLAKRGVWHDQVSFYWYNVWLSAAHALPCYYRYTHAAATELGGSDCV